MSRGTPGYRGRYNEPVPTSNLVFDEDDYPEFEPFGDEANPRGYAPYWGGSLSVVNVDMCLQMNKQAHSTLAYDNPRLIVRRGQEHCVRVTFNRPLTPDDDFQLEYLIGSHPSPEKSSLVAVTFNHRRAGPWRGKVLEEQGASVMFGITPTANAIVGKFRLYVAIATSGGMHRTARDPDTDLYLLYNAWNPEDACFLPNEAERQEYVMNDVGIIYQGQVHAVTHRTWMYGQFELGILDACIYILDRCQMPIYDRGNIVKLIRCGSAIINSQDDNGVCVGNWGEDFSMGQSPLSWTGSVRILLQYAHTGVPVNYAQCWVFAGVFCTFLRCLGIPSRLVSNFSSAHDNTGNLKTDLIFTLDGIPDRRNTRDSIWNYHCWNEVYCARQDLPPGFGGWQCVDATPQETSHGFYRCGPASVAAIKEGILCHPFDAGFVAAEVDSDVIYHKRDRYGTLTPYKVDKTLVGQAVYTKGVGTQEANDITHTYKHPEGSRANEAAMARAEEYGCERDHSEIPDTALSVTVTAQPVDIGADVQLVASFHNASGESVTVTAHLEGTVIFYTGVTAAQFKKQTFTVTVPPGQSEHVPLTVAAAEYLPHLGSQLSLSFTVTGTADDQSVAASLGVELQTPRLDMTVTGHPQVGQEMTVTVSFTNPLGFALRDVHVSMEGPGLMNSRRHHYPRIEPGASFSWKEKFVPRLAGQKCLVAVMYSKDLSQVWGSVELRIAENV